MLSRVSKLSWRAVYLFAKYQWLYLRVCHVRKFRFFLPFLTRRETISIQRWGSEPSPNADNPKDILCLRVQLRCCGSCFQRLICLHAWALLSVSCFCKYLFLWILSPSFWTTLHSDGYYSSLLARRSFWMFSAWRDRYVQALYGTNELKPWRPVLLRTIVEKCVYPSSVVYQWSYDREKPLNHSCGWVSKTVSYFRSNIGIGGHSWRLRIWKRRSLCLLRSQITFDHFLKDSEF